MRRKAIFAALLIIFLVSGAAWADFYVIPVGGGGTKITSLPYTITKTGFYYLGGDLKCPTSAPKAITVSVENVTIDLMGFTLEGALAGTGTGDGIYISTTNVEVRNGTIMGFEGNGITVADDGVSANHRILNIRAINNGNGIILGGQSHLVKGCTVSQNGGAGISASKSIIEGNVVRNNNTGINGSDSLIIGNLAKDNSGGDIEPSGNTLIDNKE